jgi:tetratricopeptide (TPR) repeat protein
MMKKTVLFLLTITTTLCCYTQTEVDEYLSSAMAKMKTNQDFRGCIIDLSKAIELDPNCYLAYGIRGQAKYYLGDYVGAIQDYNKMTEITKDARACRGIGDAKLMLGDAVGAIQDYNKAIQYNSKDTWAYSGRGKAKSMREDFKGAFYDYNKAIELNPNIGAAYLGRGLAKKMLELLNYEDFEEYELRGACLDFRKAAELGEDHAYEYIRKYCQ